MIQKLKKSLQGLLKLLPNVDIIFCSELTRAWQTAELVSESYNLPYQKTPLLNHGACSSDSLNWLRKQQGETILIIGHEPDLSILVAKILQTTDFSSLYLKKGGILFIKKFPFDSELFAKLPPKVLRALK